MKKGTEATQALVPIIHTTQTGTPQPLRNHSGTFRVVAGRCLQGPSRDSTQIKQATISGIARKYSTADFCRKVVVGRHKLRSGGAPDRCGPPRLRGHAPVSRRPRSGPLSQATGPAAAATAVATTATAAAPAAAAPRFRRAAPPRRFGQSGLSLCSLLSFAETSAGSTASGAARRRRHRDHHLPRRLVPPPPPIAAAPRQVMFLVVLPLLFFIFFVGFHHVRCVPPSPTR